MYYVKGNRQVTTENKNEGALLLADGYNEIDENGVVVKYSTSAKVSQTEYSEAVVQIESLKAEVETLQKLASATAVKDLKKQLDAANARISELEKEKDTTGGK